MTRVLPRPPAHEAPPAEIPAQALRRTLDCDICVVGDDVCALLLAFDLAHRGEDVILVPGARAPRLGIGGVLAPGYALPAVDLVERVGEADAQELLVLSAAAAARGHDMAGAAGLALGPKGRLKAARTHAADDLKREHAVRAALAPDSCVLLETADAAALLGTDLFACVLGVVPAERVDAAALRAVLTEAAKAEGVRVLDTPATSADTGGLRKYILAGGVRIRAFRVAFCGAASVAGFLPEVAAALRNEWWVCGTLAVPDAGAVPYGGLAEETGATGLAFHFDGATATFAAETATQVRGARSAGRVLRRHAGEVYPMLGRAAASEVRPVRLARLRQSMPVIQETTPGVFHAVTEGDAELAHGVLAAGLIAGAMLDRDDRMALFQPFSLAVPVRTIGGLSRVAAYWHARLSAQLAGRAHPPAPAAAAAEEAAPVIPAMARSGRGARPERGIRAASRSAVRAALGVAMRKGRGSERN